jgi:hypothetical protein
MLLFIQAVVPRMAHRDEQIAAQCCSAVRALLSGEDKSGGATAREAVQLVADLVKRRKCQCSPAVVDALLGIRLAPTDVVQPSGPGSNPSQCSSFCVCIFFAFWVLYVCLACSLLPQSPCSGSEVCPAICSSCKHLCHTVLPPPPLHFFHALPHCK